MSFDDLTDSLFAAPVNGIHVSQFDLLPQGPFENRAFLVADVDAFSDVTWFTDRDRLLQDTGKLTFKELIRQDAWDTVFGEHRPSASLSWFDGQEQSQTMVFQMERPILNENSSKYFIKVAPVDPLLDFPTNLIGEAVLNIAPIQEQDDLDRLYLLDYLNSVKSSSNDSSNQSELFNNSVFVAPFYQVEIDSEPAWYGDTTPNSFTLSLNENQQVYLSSFHVDDTSGQNEHVSFKQLSDKAFWDDLFSDNKPNASLTWFDANGNSKNLVFSIDRPRYNVFSGKYMISATPLEPNNGCGCDPTVEINSETIQQPVLFIDPSQASADASTTDEETDIPKIAKIAGGILLGAGTVYAAYKIYGCILASKQASSYEYIADKNLEDLTSLFVDALEGQPDARLLGYRLSIVYRDRFRSWCEAIENFKNDPDGYANLDAFIDQDEFTASARNGVNDILGEFRGHFSEANFTELRERLVNDIRYAQNTAYQAMQDLYAEDGPAGIFRFYAEKFNISAEELMQNPELFRDFSQVARAIRTDLNLARINSQNAIRSAAEDADFPCGMILAGGSCWDGNVASEFTEEPASQVAGQMIEDGIADSEEIDMLGEVLEDIIGILI